MNEGMERYRTLAAGRVVHFLGPIGTFAHAATLKAFGNAATLIPQPDILAVFEARAQDPDALGVVPIENSTEGGVNLTMEALLDHSSQRVIGEIIVPVEQCLLGSGPLERIEVVFSHAHGLAQCKHWLRTHLPNAKPTVVGSTAMGASLAASTPNSGAVASELAARAANVPVLVRGIQDRAVNATRFFILGQEPLPPTGRDKTSLVFAAPHRKGALHDLLGIFARHEINLTRIESRPMPGHLWHYVFFVDVEGHQSEPHLQQALTEVREHTSLLSVLGSYPAALTADDEAPPSI